jgi:transcriptional regulator NrdR family protein
MTGMKVVKRDGSTEEFKLEKIARVVKAAGLDEQDSENLAQRVSRVVEGQEVSSLEIRDHVLDELKNTNEYAANMYRWYQETKDNHQNG